ATFTVRLPGATAASAPIPPPARAAQPSASPTRILLVEDHGDTARTLCRLLRRTNRDVQTAANVEDALKCASANSYDLLISDLGLPDGSGLDLMRQLREKYNLKGIALSGYGMEEDMRRSHEA